MWDFALQYVRNEEVNVNIQFKTSDGFIDLASIACEHRHRNPTPIIESMKNEVCTYILLRTRCHVFNNSFVSGKNLLMKEIEYGVVKCSPYFVHLMIVGNINLKHVCANGETALSLAFKTQNREVINLILYHANFTGTTEERAIYPFFLIP